MNRSLDLNRFPLSDIEGTAGRALVHACRTALEDQDLFSLEGFVTPAAPANCVAGVRPVLDNASFTHARRQTPISRKVCRGLASDHPALAKLETVNHTICAAPISSAFQRIKADIEWPEGANASQCVNRGF